MSAAQRSACCKKNIRRGKCVWCGNHTTGYIPLGSAKSTVSPSPGGGGVFGIFAGQRAQQPQPQPRAVPGEWTADADKQLWKGRDGSLASLAQQMGRGVGGVSSRLGHLRDPTHKAYQRLHGTACTASAPAAPLDTGKLNAMQLRAVELALQGASFFLTGGAGTGKSFTLDFVVRALQRMHGAQNVFVAASTGIAACHIGGTTLHSFAGVGLAQEPVCELASRVQNNRVASGRWRACRALVVDEVSMLDSDFFDKVEEIARRMRDSEEPFGGVQLVLCGDFFQLPPVSKGGAKAHFLFESATWARVVQRSVVLTEVFRQADASFVNLLNEMRRGQLSDANVALLRSHMAACLLADRQRAGAAGGEGAGSGGGGAGGASGGSASIADRLKLFPHNQPADAENARRLAQLGGTARMSTVRGHGALLAGCQTSPPRPA